MTARCPKCNGSGRRYTWENKEFGGMEQTSSVCRECGGNGRDNLLLARLQQNAAECKRSGLDFPADAVPNDRGEFR